MTASAEISIIAALEGLGKSLEVSEKFSVTTAPTALTYAYITQTTTNTAQVLELGDVSTIGMIIIKAVSKDLSIDTSYVSTFAEELYVLAGELAIFKPSGVVQIKNKVVGETCVFEVWIIGLT